MPIRQPSTPLRRAVVPVVAGIGFFALLGLLTWGVAALLAHHGKTVSRSLASPVFEVGNATAIAPIVDAEGPLLFQGLIGDSADKSLVLDHTGTDVLHNWTVYYAHPADGDPTCKVKQVQHTRTFTDCTGRQLQVEQLAPPPGVKLFVLPDGTIRIDLQGALTAVSTTIGSGTIGSGTIGSGTIGSGTSAP